MAHAAKNLHAVLLNLHAAATTVAPLPPRQFSVNPAGIDRQTRRQAFNNRDQRPTV
jgi:hypothetical protein